MEKAANWGTPRALLSLLSHTTQNSPGVVPPTLCRALPSVMNQKHTPETGSQAHLMEGVPPQSKLPFPEGLQVVTI